MPLESNMDDEGLLINITGRQIHSKIDTTSNNITGHTHLNTANIDDRSTDTVSLIDISCNKKWICYISHKKRNDYGDDRSSVNGSKFELDKDHKKIVTYITRRKFSEIGEHVEGEECYDDDDTKFNFAASSRQNSQSSNILRQISDTSVPIPEAEVSTDITDLINITPEEYQRCIFLSVSPDGQHAVLSSINEDSEDSAEKSYCMIFKVDDKPNKVNPCFKLYHKLKFSGRAVFLNTKKKSKHLRLALLNTETLQVYKNFSNKSRSPDYFYDLSTFFPQADGSRRESFSYQESFIENITWANSKIKEYTPKMKNIITLSRHIRDNVVVTPFQEEDGNEVVRVWSIIDDGVRLTSFSAPGEHIIAFSKDLKYAATMADGIRSVNIFNVKSGLLVYTLKSRHPKFKGSSYFEISHARFCYDSRYFSLSLLVKNSNNDHVISMDVVYEIWYIEAEKSIHITAESTKLKNDYANTSIMKTVRPFVTRDFTPDKKKCLKGIFTNLDEDNKIILQCIELNIDHNNKLDNPGEDGKNADPFVRLVDILETKDGNDPEPPSNDQDAEILNNLDEYDQLKCADVYVGNEKKYLIRFGRSMIQLWKLKNEQLGIDEDELVYIRAYKGPNYGLLYSFKETWEIHNFDSIKFIGGESPGRMIVNIKEDIESIDYDDTDKDLGIEKGDEKTIYHTEEIFLPISSDDANYIGEFDYHKLESACQALHYLESYCTKHKIQIMKLIQEENNEVQKRKNEYLEEIRFNEKMRREDDMEEKDKEAKEHEKQKKRKKNVLALFRQTLSIITTSIHRIDKDSNFFSTMSGSRALAMLASFPVGRQIIKDIIRNESIPISIFSYPICINDNYSEDIRNSAHVLRTKTYGTPNEPKEGITYRSSPDPDVEIRGTRQSIAENENVLTVLITELDYNLYKLLFNRILFDSKKIGPGCLSALVDALVFLQEEGNTDLLLNSSQKLSYLQIEKSTLGILDTEIDEKLQVSNLQKEFVSSIRNLECHATIEQMPKYISRFWYNPTRYLAKHYRVKCMLVSIKTKWSSMYKTVKAVFIDTSQKGAKNRTKVCVVPLSYFNTYNRLPEDKKQLLALNGKTKKHGKLYKGKSSFVTVASDQDDNNIFRQGDTVLEVMLQYKWKQFIRKRFVFICLIHLTYYISYCTGVLFAKELYDYQVAPFQASGQHLTSLIILLISGLVLIVQELHQIARARVKKDYFMSGYNYVDMLAFIFPLVTFIQLAEDGEYFYEFCCISTLILWLHGILRLRAIQFFGIAIETIIQLAYKVTSILFILFIIVIAFTHSLMVLLRRQPDDFFQENFNGTITLPNGEEGTTNFFGISSSNGFTDPFKAFYQVWLIIFGVWDPLINGNAGDDKMLFVLCILFAFITILIFTNMVIAIMSSTVEEVKQRGKKVWVSHFAAVIAEIELLWCPWFTKRDRENNPSYIYYIANSDAVKKHEDMLQKETESLRKEMYTTVVDVDTREETRLRREIEKLRKEISEKCSKCDTGSSSFMTVQPQ